MRKSFIKTLEIGANSKRGLGIMLILLEFSFLIILGREGLLKQWGKSLEENIYKCFMPVAIYKREESIVSPSFLVYLEKELRESGRQEEENIEQMVVRSWKWREDSTVSDTKKDFQGHFLMDMLQEENEAAYAENERNRVSEVFEPHSKQVIVNLEELREYESLVEQFYTIDANTMAGSNQLNVDKLLNQDMRINQNTEDTPQILVYHTHSREGFADSLPGDVNTSIVGVGRYLAEVLENVYGYKVMHHTGQYDLDVRDEAYSKALPEVEKILEENPDIQVVIDLHRDEMPEDTKLLMNVDGRPTARFMFFNGLSRTKRTGEISYLNNPYQEENLAFSFQMKLKAEEYYPGITRKNYLKGYRYNMHVCPKTLLVELGAQNNTVEEAMNACDVLAHLLDMVLRGE